MMWGHGDHGMTWIGVTVMVLLIVLIASVVLLVLRVSAASRTSGSDATATATLAYRLATGDITVEQYEVTREALRRGAGS
ncbi:MAG: hypothetical protein JWN20_343 [Jatrophihabitantaceae bacterium]|nr:hypothetical protein [Jatrophihabitantaceae bacterium]